MTVLYFLVVSVLYNGVPVEGEYSAEFGSVYECMDAASLFVAYVASPGFKVTVECVPKEVNDA